jgi:hypothetical protein
MLIGHILSGEGLFSVRDGTSVLRETQQQQLTLWT